MNEVDARRDRATPASVRHDDDEPLTPISLCAFIQSKDGDLGLTTLSITEGPITKLFAWREGDSRGHVL
jgi:hypothetical protein